MKNFLSNFDFLQNFFNFIKNFFLVKNTFLPPNFCGGLLFYRFQTRCNKKKWKKVGEGGKNRKVPDFLQKKFLAKMFIKMLRFQLIDQKQNSINFFRSLMMAHMFKIQFSTKNC